MTRATCSPARKRDSAPPLTKALTSVITGGAASSVIDVETEPKSTPAPSRSWTLTFFVPSPRLKTSSTGEVKGINVRVTAESSTSPSINISDASGATTCRETSRISVNSSSSLRVAD